MLKKVVDDQRISGTLEVTSVVAKVDRTKNELSCTGGVALSQWVLGRLPRVPGSQYDQDEAFDLGALANAASHESDAFSRQSAIRASPRLAFAKIDVGSPTS